MKSTPANAAHAARLAIRSGTHHSHTAGLAPGHVQGNLCILPKAYSPDFLLFCQRNPKPCPILAVGEPGDPRLPSLGADIDVRTDVPAYRVFKDGISQGDFRDLKTLWRDDLVTFVLGCSFSFEQALMEAGLPLRYVAQGKNVPMYRTSIDTTPAGPFRGKLVVSMRPFNGADAIRAIQITSRMPTVHGAPIHIGSPEQIGITDLSKPWVGDATEVLAGELPLFWACGVTPQSVALDAKLPLMITHVPGHMLITDLRNSDLVH